MKKEKFKLKLPSLARHLNKNQQNIIAAQKEFNKLWTFIANEFSELFGEILIDDHNLAFNIGKRIVKLNIERDMQQISICAKFNFRVNHYNSSECQYQNEDLQIWLSENDLTSWEAYDIENKPYKMSYEEILEHLLDCLVNKIEKFEFLFPVKK